MGTGPNIAAKYAISWTNLLERTSRPNRWFALMKGENMASSLLTQDQIHWIHDSSLTILERVGVEVPHPEMLARFADSGAQIDPHTKRVRIPADLVNRSLQQAG